MPGRDPGDRRTTSSMLPLFSYTCTDSRINWTVPLNSAHFQVNLPTIFATFLQSKSKPRSRLVHVRRQRSPLSTKQPTSRYMALRGQQQVSRSSDTYPLQCRTWPESRNVHVYFLQTTIHLFAMYTRPLTYHPCFLIFNTLFTAALNPSLNLLRHLSLFSLFLFIPGLS